MSHSENNTSPVPSPSHPQLEQAYAQLKRGLAERTDRIGAAQAEQQLDQAWAYLQSPDMSL